MNKVILSFWVLLVFGINAGCSLPNIRLALEVGKSFPSKTGGTYVRSDALQLSILPAIEIIANHLMDMENREKSQEEWLLYIVISNALFLGIWILAIVMRRIVKRGKRKDVGLESIKVEK